MAFDGIVTKAICSELSFLEGARIDKIFQPNKNNIILGMFNKGKNFALNICTESSNCRIHLTTHSVSNPQVAPNFCMILRKNILGLHFKKIYTLDLERLVIIDFEGLDDVDDVFSRKLIIEIMGKHSNVILLDEQNIIIDSLRHIKHDEPNEKNRDIIPHIRYKFPISDKYNFLEISNFNNFCEILSPKILNVKILKDELPNIIFNTFNGFSKNFIYFLIKKLIEKKKWIFESDITSYKTNLHLIYDEINNIIDNIDSNKLSFCTDLYFNKRDYFLYFSNTENSPFSLNFFIDDFYFSKETLENFTNYRNSLLKLILNVLGKYNKRLIHINEKLKDCDNMNMFRIYGELITANLYKFDNNSKLDLISVENYYDNQNIIDIPLDKRFSISQNAKKYFKKYNKLKNALEVVSIQKSETEKELDYIQSIVFELENSSDIENLVDIYDEISDNIVFKDTPIANNKYFSDKKNAKLKKSKLTKNKNVSFNPIKYSNDDYIILVGRNNIENDYLTLKYANKSDIWFHVKDFHGSHTILKILKLPSDTSNILDNIPYELLYKAAKIAVEHSKAKNSSNVPVDFCEVKFVKKPNGSKPGMVIYTNYRTIYVK